MSDASLSVGCRSTFTPASTRRSTRDGSVESRSPMSRSGWRPSRSSDAAPPSAAMTRSAPSSHAASAGSRSPDATTATFIVPPFVPETTNGTPFLFSDGRGARRGSSCFDFLRRHDPDQVRGSANASASALSALSRSPVAWWVVRPA